MIRLLVFMVSYFVVTGCGVRAPLTQYYETTIIQSTPEAIAMEVEFDVSNTNDEPLRLTTYQYTVSAGGSTVYRGKYSAQQTVPRWSTVRSTIPIVIRRDAIRGSQHVAWRLSGSLGYIPPTEFAETLLKSGLWKPTTVVRAHGSATMPPIN